jgi:hypothetical protein
LSAELLAHPGLVLLTREECGLCDEMRCALQALQATTLLPHIALVDVDSDAILQRRYGLQIPVLLLDGSPVCRARLDEAALLDALKRRR